MFSDDMRDEFLARIAAGESVNKVCKDPRMPAYSTVMKWAAEDEAFSEKYARAREDRSGVIFEEMLDIADDATAETVQQDRLRIDTRKWMLSKMAPRKYGDKLSVSGEDGGPLQVVINRFAQDHAS